MAPRTNACNRIRHFERAPLFQRNELHTHPPWWDTSRHNSRARFRRHLHSTHRTLKSSRRSANTIYPVFGDRLALLWCRRHAIWAQKPLSPLRGARSLFDTHALRSNASEDAGETLQVEAGDADPSKGNITAWVYEDNTDGLESKLSSQLRNDIKVFKRLWNQRIINVSRDFKSEDKGHSKFQISLRILKGVENDTGRKLRVRGELESNNMVRTHCLRRLR